MSTVLSNILFTLSSNHGDTVSIWKHQCTLCLLQKRLIYRHTTESSKVVNCCPLLGFWATDRIWSCLSTTGFRAEKSVRLQTGANILVYAKFVTGLYINVLMCENIFTWTRCNAKPISCIQLTTINIYCGVGEGNYVFPSDIMSMCLNSENTLRISVKFHTAGVV